MPIFSLALRSILFAMTALQRSVNTALNDKNETNFQIISKALKSSAVTTTPELKEV